MAKKQKQEDQAPEAEKGTESGNPAIAVETNNEVMDMDAEAQKASDPYARKPEVKESTLDRGVTLETYT